MSEDVQNNGNAPDSGDMENQNQDTGNAPDSGENNDSRKGEPMLPKSRYDKVNGKLKAAEEALNGIADELLADVPEDLRDVVPDLPPAEKIKWIRNAQAKGLFQADKRESNSPDSKRPGSKSGTDSVSSYEEYYKNLNQ